MRYIRDEPGITRMELVKQLNIGRSAARHHLHVLTRQGYIMALDARNPGYVLNAVALDGLSGPEARQLLAVLANETRRSILQAAATGIDHRKFSEEAQISRSAFSKHCQRLAEAGLLTRQDLRGRTTWFARSTMEEIRMGLTNTFAARHGWI